MHENVPVRFGRGRLDSLGNKGLAAYLIATTRWNLEREETDADSVQIQLSRLFFEMSPSARASKGSFRRYKSCPIEP
jgi:hypothetical protein